jgi:hypothetical protein
LFCWVLGLLRKVGRIHDSCKLTFLKVLSYRVSYFNFASLVTVGISESILQVSECSLEYSNVERNENYFSVCKVPSELQKDPLAVT